MSLLYLLPITFAALFFICFCLQTLTAYYYKLFTPTPPPPPYLLHNLRTEITASTVAPVRVLQEEDILSSH